MDNQVVRFESVDIPVLEYKGQRVITFKLIDQVHGRVEGTAARNFHENKDRFRQGYHFFHLQYQEFKMKHEFRTSLVTEIPNPQSGLILITERGYLLLVKSLNDDLAWEIQERLVDAYFRVKEIPQNNDPTRWDEIVKKLKTESAIITETLTNAQKMKISFDHAQFIAADAVKAATGTDYESILLGLGRKRRAVLEQSDTKPNNNFMEKLFRISDAISDKDRQRLNLVMNVRDDRNELWVNIHGAARLLEEYGFMEKSDIRDLITVLSGHPAFKTHKNCRFKDTCTSASKTGKAFVFNLDTLNEDKETCYYAKTAQI